MSENYRFHVTDVDENERIDKYIAGQIDSLSRSFIQKMLKEGRILVNGSQIKANYRLRGEDEISFFLPEAVEPDEVAGVISIVLGFALMMALDVALG